MSTQSPSHSALSIARSDSSASIRERYSHLDHWSTPPSSPSSRKSSLESGSRSLFRSLSAGGSASSLSHLDRYRGERGAYGSSGSLYSTPHSLPSTSGLHTSSSSSSPLHSAPSQTPSSLSSYGTGTWSSLGSLSSTRQRRWGSWFTSSSRPRSSKF